MHQVGDDFNVSLNNFISVSTGVSQTPVVSYVNEVRTVETTATQRDHPRNSAHSWGTATQERLSRLAMRLTSRDAQKNSGR